VHAPRVRGDSEASISEKEVREVFERYVQALYAHEFDRMAEFIHDELTENGQSVTRDDVIAELKGHGDAVPDFTWRVYRT
jgi:predicted ester cyclase